MTNVLIGILIGLLVGAGCRWFHVPVPAPPSLIGALLVVAITVGYAATDHYLTRDAAPEAEISGGPTGEVPEE